MGRAAEALKAVDGDDAEVLARVGERARRNAGHLWESEGRACPDDHVDLAAAWIDDAKGSRLWLALFTLPTLVLAVEGAATDPQGILANGTRWLWCHDEAERSSRDLMEWVKAHGKAPATPTKGTGGGAPPRARGLRPPGPP